MVSFLKSKGTSFVNKPVGVVSSATGGEQLANTIFQTANNLSNQFFAQAKADEIKKGKDAAMLIQTRDDNGALRVEGLPPSLSDVAQQSGQNVLNQIYANELAEDMNSQITKARANSNGDVETFGKLASAYIGQTEKLLQTQGGSQYIPLLRRAGAKYLAQHQNAMVLQEAKNADKRATNLELSNIGSNLQELDGLLTQGYEFTGDDNEDISVEQLEANLYNRVDALLYGGKISGPKSIELRNDIQKTVLTAKTRNKLNPMGSSLDIQAVRILKNFALDNTITEEEKEVLTKYGVNDEWLNDFDGVARSNRDYIVQRINQYETAINTKLTSIKADNDDIEFATKFESSDIIKITGKEEKLYDKYLAKKYNNGVPLTNADIYRIARTANGLQDLLKHNGLPQKVKHMFQNLPSMITKIQKEGRNALPELMEQINVFRNMYGAFGVSGNISNESFRSSIGDETFDQWLSINTRVQLYGEDNLEYILRDVQSMNIDIGARTAMQEKNLAMIDPKFEGKSVNSGINSLLTKFRNDGVFGTGADFNPESMIFLRTIARKELAIDGTDVSLLKEVLKNSYNALYVESSLVYSPIQNTGETSYFRFKGIGNKYLRSRFAPERFFGTGDVLDGFKIYVNKQVSRIMGDGKEYKVGENIFLYPTNRSGTMGTAEYMVVSGDGQNQIIKPDGDIISITTNGYIKKLKDENKVKFEKQIEELKAMRIAKIKKFRKQKDAVLKTDSGEDKNFLLQMLEGYFATQNPTGN